MPLDGIHIKPTPPRAPSTVLSVRAVAHRYAPGADWVLRRVHGDILAGQSLALVGESGGGKSTLLNILAGFLSPSQGSVTWVDASSPASSEWVHGTDQWRAQALAVVHQHHQLMPDFTARENVALAAQSAGSPWAWAMDEAAQHLKELGLAHRMDVLPGVLSGGERQRVGLARALVHRPRLLLADEPTASLDPKRAQQVREVLLEKVHTTGMALVWVTHDPVLAQRLDRMCILSEGCVDFCAPKISVVVPPSPPFAQMSVIQSNP